MNPIELIGISATVLVFISFTQSEVIRIRSINAVGCILFIIYGVLLHAHSVWILNSACLILNIYKICKELSKKSKNSA